MNKRLLLSIVLLSSFAFGKDAYKISGLIIDSDGNTVPKTQVILKSSGDLEIQTTTTSKKRIGRGGGKFEFKKVPPGKYTLMVDGSELGMLLYPFDVVDKNIKLGKLSLSAEGQDKNESTLPLQNVPLSDRKIQEETLAPQFVEEEKTPKEELLPASEKSVTKIIPVTQLNLPDTSFSVEQNDSLEVLPTIRTPREKVEMLPGGELFFEMRSNIQNLQVQMDSLKKVIKVYEKSKSIPTINEELLNLIKIPQLQHRIELTNGSVVIGEIIDRNDLEILVQTSIGELAIDSDKIMQITDVLPPAARVELVGDPKVDVYPEREEITGMVKNVSKKRADFVRVVANLWAASTNLVAKDSVFVIGSKKKYLTGISTDTAIEPGATATFKIIIPITDSREKVEYRTYEIFWEETK